MDYIKFGGIQIMIVQPDLEMILFFFKKMTAYELLFVPKSGYTKRMGALFNRVVPDRFSPHSLKCHSLHPA